VRPASGGSPMITYLVTVAGDHTFRGSVILDDPRLAGRFEVLTYREAFERRRWRCGAVVFADVDRLDGGSALRAAHLRRDLQQTGAPMRLLNHPTRSCRRFALLRRLHGAGINVHNVYRGDENRGPIRYPVFVRRESAHDGTLTSLLHDEAALRREIDRLTVLGFLPQDLLIVELCDTREPDGVYRKYTAFVVGDAVFQRYAFYGDDWHVKDPRGGDVRRLRPEADMLEEERAFLDGDEHVALLRRAAALGEISFGRIDFGLKDGRPEIWEINTNPDPAIVVSGEATERDEYIRPTGHRILRDALAALDNDAAHDTTVTVAPMLSADDCYRVFLRQVAMRSDGPAPGDANR
jgi:hypothetical protein